MKHADRVGPVIEETTAPGTHEHVPIALEAESLQQFAGRRFVQRFMHGVEIPDLAARGQSQAHTLAGRQIPRHETRPGDPVAVHPAHAPQPETLATRRAPRAQVDHARTELPRATVLRRAAGVVEYDDIRMNALHERVDRPGLERGRPLDEVHWIRGLRRVRCIATRDKRDRASGPAALHRTGKCERPVELAGSGRTRNRHEQHSRWPHRAISNIGRRYRMRSTGSSSSRQCCLWCIGTGRISARRAETQAASCGWRSMPR